MKEESTQLKTKTLSGLFWKFSERIFAQVVTLVVSIILARILVPDDYGVVSIVAIFFAFANVFITGGFSSALMQKKDADIQDYSNILYINLLFSICIYGVLFFTAPFIAKMYSQPILTSVIRVMGLTLFVNSFKSVLCAYVSSKLQFRKFFVSAMAGTTISAVVGISMALNGYGCWALVAQQMTSALIDTCVLFFMTKVRFVFKLDVKKSKGLFKYGWKLLVASEISVLYDEINPLIIGLRFSNADLAFYSKGKSFPSLINSTVGDTLSAVLFPVMAKIQDDKEAILACTRRFMQVASFIIFPLMIGFLTVAENFVLVVLTEKWLGATRYIQAFCIVYMLSIIQTGNLQVIRAIGRSDIILVLEIIKKSIYFVVILLFVLFTKDPLYLAFACIVNTIFASIVNTAPNRKLIGYRYRLQVLDLLPNCIIAIIMGVAVYFVGLIPISSMLVTLCLQVLVGAIVYMAINLIIRNKSLLYLFEVAMGFLKKNKKQEVEDK